MGEQTKLKKGVYPCLRLYHYLLFTVNIYQQQRSGSTAKLCSQYLRCRGRADAKYFSYGFFLNI